MAAADPDGVVLAGNSLLPKENRYLTDRQTKVLLEKDGMPILTVHDFGSGKGIYLSSFQLSEINIRLLYQLIRYAGGEEITGMYMTDNPYTECAYYPNSGKLVVINNTREVQSTCVETHVGIKKMKLEAFETVVVNL